MQDFSPCIQQRYRKGSDEAIALSVNNFKEEGKVKKFVLGIICGMLALFMCVPAMAATVNGWDSSSGSPVYYQNGVKLSNTWVKWGNTFYYLNENGNIVPNFVVNQDGLAYSGIQTYIDTNTSLQVTNVAQAEPQAYKAVREICGVTDDYDAFKKRNPQIVAQYAADPQGLYQAYVASYEGQPVANKYMDLYVTYLESIYNAHRYDYRYDNMWDGTHKAYCECGAWVIQNCNRDIELAPGGPYMCNACHAKFHYNEDKPFYDEEDD